MPKRKMIERKEVILSHELCLKGGLLANMVPVKTATKFGHTVVCVNTTEQWLREFICGNKSGGSAMSVVQFFVDQARLQLAESAADGSAPTAKSQEHKEMRGRSAFESEDEAQEALPATLSQKQLFSKQKIRTSTY